MILEETVKNIDLTLLAPTEEPERQYYYIAKCKEKIAELEEKLGRKPTACVVTFGCPSV